MALYVYVCVFVLVHRRWWSDLAKQLTTPLGTLAVLLAAFSFFVLGVETVDSNSLPRPRVRGQSHQNFHIPAAYRDLIHPQLYVPTARV
jgi:hypothetical protein